MTTNTDPVRALAELVDAAALMLCEIDTCGHEVDPAYRATLHDAWTKGQAVLASAPPSAPVGVDVKAMEDAAKFLAGRFGEHDGWAKSIRNAITALAQQPAAPHWGNVPELDDEQSATPSGEAVAYRWRDRGTMQMVYSSTNPGYCNVEPLYAAPQQPAAVDEAPTWSRQQPTVPGIYGIRGFNLCRPASEQFEAVVVVREHGGELVCNLHESTSEDDLESWAPICDLDPDFEWRVFVPGWEQRGGRALAAQQQGGA